MKIHMFYDFQELRRPQSIWIRRRYSWRRVYPATRSWLLWRKLERKRPMWEHARKNRRVKLPLLKPQHSFGEFNHFFLNLQKVQEIIRKHHQTFLQLFGLTYCNAILPNGKLSLCTLCTLCSGGLRTFWFFFIFPENGSILRELLTGH